MSCPIMYLRPLADRLVPKHCIDVIRHSKPEVHFQEIDGPHLLLQCEPVRAWCEYQSFWRGFQRLGTSTPVREAVLVPRNRRSRDQEPLQWWQYRRRSLDRWSGKPETERSETLD